MLQERWNTHWLLYQSAVTHVDSAGYPLSKNTNEFTFHFVSKKELKDIRVPRFCEVYEKGETDTNKVLV